MKKSMKLIAGVTALTFLLVVQLKEYSIDVFIDVLPPLCGFACRLLYVYIF
jgi:hypothetical protein